MPQKVVQLWLNNDKNDYSSFEYSESYRDVQKC